MEFARTTANSPASYDAGLRAHMISVYNVMAGGLALSAIIAAAVAFTDFGHLFFAFGRRGVSPTALGLIGMFAPLAMLLVAMFTKANNWSIAATRAFYWTFTAAQGIGLSVVFATHGSVDVTRALLATAGAFAGLSIYGYTTGRSLSGVGSFCIMGLFGMIGLGLVGLIGGFQIPSMAMGILGVIVFSGLTAWNTQQIKTSYIEQGGNERTAVWGALNLYLDAMNLFRSILNLVRGD